MALAGVEFETLVSKPDALTTRTPPCATEKNFSVLFCNYVNLRVITFKFSLFCFDNQNLKSFLFYRARLQGDIFL